MSLRQRLRELLTEENKAGIRTRMATGGAWSFLLNISNRALSLTRVTVVAAFLAPEQFGIFGFAALTLAVLQATTDTGLKRTLIQQAEDDVDPFLDTVWTVQVARGLFLTAVGFTVAPFVGQFFATRAAVPVVRAVSLTALLQGLQNPAVVYFDKNLRFSQKLKLELSGGVVGTVVSIALAVVTGSVWALVAGQLLTTGTRTVVSHFQVTFRPSIDVDRERLHELFDFGRWITASTLFTFVITTADDVFVGWFFGAGALGPYQLAYRLANAPASEITDTLNSVTRPGYADARTDPETLRRVFSDAVRLVYLVVLPMGAGIYLVAEPFVRALYGPEWVQMIGPLQAFAVVGLFRSTLSVFGPLNEALGNPEYNTTIQFLGGIALAVAMLPLSELFGVQGTALATGARFLIAIPIILYVVVVKTPIHLQETVRVASQPALATLGMAGAVVLFQSTTRIGPLFELIGAVAVGVVGYSLLVYVTDVALGYGSIRRLTEAV